MPQRVPFGQHLFRHTKIASGTLFLNFDHQMLPIFSHACIFSSSLHGRLHFWVAMLLFTMSCCGMSFFLVVYTLKLICYTFSEYLLNIFLTYCGCSCYLTDFPSFYIVLLNLKQLCHFFTFYFSKKSLMFHAIYLFNNIKYFWSLLQLYITVAFGEKRRNETTNLELIWDPTLRNIDFVYTS